MTEVISGGLVLIGSQLPEFFIVFFFVPNFVTPILYYMGMESKRNAIKSYFLQMSKKTKVSPLRRPFDQKGAKKSDDVLVESSM